MYIYGYALFFCEIDEEWSCSCWIVNGFMIICCCFCCFGMGCWWINALGMLIYGLVKIIVVVVEGLVKHCEIVELWWIDVLIFKFCEFLSVFSCKWPVNIFGTSFWHLKKIKIWDFGWKRFETLNFLTELMSVRLSEHQASSKQTSPVGSGHRSLERAPSELQTSEPRSY